MATGAVASMFPAAQSQAMQAPGLPAYNLNTLAAADQGNVNTLFDPNFGRTETQTNAAENALAGGFSGSGYASGQQARLLDSERKANMLLGHQILDPYLQRQQQSALESQQEQARLNEIAAQGAQALQQLQISEAGQGARLSQELAARLQQQVLEGQQAMQRLTLSEAGATGRARLGVQGDLARTLLTAALSGGGTSRTVNPTPLPSYHWQTDLHGNVIGGQPPPANYPTTSSGGGIRTGIGTSTIDRILRQYGLL